tara:strand:+ start:426 stop:545 length:120 start_codon:yes stop_codon:yes gene_type:complete
MLSKGWGVDDEDDEVLSVELSEVVKLSLLELPEETEQIG